MNTCSHFIVEWSKTNSRIPSQQYPLLVCVELLTLFCFHIPGCCKHKSSPLYYLTLFYDQPLSAFQIKPYLTDQPFSDTHPTHPWGQGPLVHNRWTLKKNLQKYSPAQEIGSMCPDM